MKERKVVLDRYDGRDTSFIAVERRWRVGPARPVLHWLVVGEVELFDVWLRMALTWDESDAFIAAPPSRYDRFVSERLGREFSLTLSTGKIRLVRVDQTVRPGGNAVKQGMDDLVDRIKRLAASHRPHADRAREVETRLPSFTLAAA